MPAIYVAPGEGQSYRMIDGDHVVKAAARETQGAFEVFEVIAPAAPMAPPHVSPWTGVLFLLEGRITALVGDTTYAVEPGGAVVFPAGTPSSFEVVGESARFVAITSGDRAGRFFADFAGSVPSDRPVQESMEAIMAVTGRHGVGLAGREFHAVRGDHERSRCERHGHASRPRRTGAAGCRSNGTRAGWRS